MSVPTLEWRFKLFTAKRKTRLVRHLLSPIRFVRPFACVSTWSEVHRTNVSSYLSSIESGFVFPGVTDGTFVPRSALFVFDVTGLISRLRYSQLHAAVAYVSPLCPSQSVQQSHVLRPSRRRKSCPGGIQSVPEMHGSAVALLLSSTSRSTRLFHHSSLSFASL